MPELDIQSLCHVASLNFLFSSDHPMDRLLQHSSPSLSPKKSTHHRSAPSPAPYTSTYDGDDDRPSVDEKPSTRRSDKHNDPDNPDKASSKKPRHRHSPVQLAALNELFDRNEHPSLEERTELAEKLGM